LERELRHALERGQLHLNFQPIVRLPGGTVAGVEALLRWRDPERGLVLPADLVYEAWLESLGETPGRSRHQLTPNRRKKIVARLREGCTVEDLCDAARGWTRDPWPERVHHNDLVVLLRNREQVEKFARLWRDGPPATASKALTRTAATRAAMQRMGGGQRA